MKQFEVSPFYLFFALILGFHISVLGALRSDDHAYVKAVYSLPLTLDPVKMNDTASIVAGNMIYSGLLKFSPTLKLLGDLAEKWETSADGKTLRFYLRKNAVFHDGTLVTANDVVGSLTRAIATGSRVEKYYDCIEGAEQFISGKSKTVTGLKDSSRHMLEVHLKYPFPPFLSVLAGATAKILPMKLLSKDTFFANPIGSGPFRFVARDDAKKELSLVRFEKHHLGLPKLNKIILKEVPETEAINMAKAGLIDDLANWPLTNENEVFESGKKITSPVAATWIVGINTTKGPFKSLATRKLFRDSINTETFRKQFYPDAFPAKGYIPPGIPGYDLALSEKVQKSATSPSNEKIKMAIPIELSRHQEMKTFFEKALQDKGWNIEVVPMAWDELMAGYTNKTHQAFLVSMNLDYPDTEFLLRNFESSNPDNFSGLKNPELDAILKQARSARDRKVREGFYHRGLKIIEDSAVVINLFHPRANYWISNCVTNFTPNILTDAYIDYSMVTFDEGCSSKLAKAKQ
ncbi:MAG: ABC transporter substrate-binding protein [Pseudomonadota bacterium]|nr:ABC transporter substrate-binding protein [Pseudomonadota bacterium]